MLLQTNSYVVPREKRAEHARLIRRFRQTLLRLGCDSFEVYEQVGANWSADDSIQRFVQILRFVDRKHQLSVQAAERVDQGAQAVIAEFCEMINFAVQQEKGLFAVGYYTSVLPIVPKRNSAGEIVSTVDQEPAPEHAPISAEVVEQPAMESLAESPAESPVESGIETSALDSGILQTSVTELQPMAELESPVVDELAAESNVEAIAPTAEAELAPHEAAPIESPAAAIEPAMDSESSPFEIGHAESVAPVASADHDDLEMLAELEPMDLEPAEPAVHPDPDAPHETVAEVAPVEEPSHVITEATAEAAHESAGDMFEPDLMSLESIEPEPVSKPRQTEVIAEVDPSELSDIEELEPAARTDSDPFEAALGHETSAEIAAETHHESAPAAAAEPVSFDSILSAIEPSGGHGSPSVFGESELTVADMPSGLDVADDVSADLLEDELIPEKAAAAELAPPELASLESTPPELDLPKQPAYEPAARASDAKLVLPVKTVLRGQFNGEHLSPDDMLGDDVPPAPKYNTPFATGIATPPAIPPVPPLPVPGQVHSTEFFDKSDDATAVTPLDDDFDITELEELPEPIVEHVDESVQAHGIVEDDLLVEEEFEGSWEHAKPTDEGGHREPAKNPRGW